MDVHRILVTGGAGFIGSHVADAYLAAGHHVVVIDNLSSGQNNAPAGSRLHRTDIRDARVEGVFDDFRPTVLCHHAAQMDVRKSVADPRFDAEVNILGTLHLLECCRKYECGQVIFASTGGAIYGEPLRHPADESHATLPVSPYGCSKLSIEHYLYYYKEQFGIKTLALRYANVYGPRQNAMGEAGVVAIFCRQLLSGESPVIFGDGTQTRDYVYVDDVVAANLLGVERQLEGVFNVGTGVETSVNALFSQLTEILELDVAPRYAPGKPGEQRRSSIDGSALIAATGWKPTTSLNNGLWETVEFFRDRHQASAAE